MLTRRKFNTLLLGGISGVAVSGCSSFGSLNRNAPEGAELNLLYYADTHARFSPSFQSHPASLVGPRRLLGLHPFVRDNRDVSDELMGGYAGLQQSIQNVKAQRGEDKCIAIESGECWSGSALSSLIGAGPASESTLWAGADVRLASSERGMWSAAHCEAEYEALQKQGVITLTNDSPATIMKRNGIKLALVGVENPWHHSEELDARGWVTSIQKTINKVRNESDLVVVLCDAGTLSSIFLSEHIVDADLILSSGSGHQSQEIIVSRPSRSIPIVLGGRMCQSLQNIFIYSNNYGGWVFEVSSKSISPVFDANNAINKRISELRKPVSSWLETESGIAGRWIYKSSFFDSPWDRIITSTLHSVAENAAISISPDYGYDSIIPPGHPITRENLLDLSGGRSTTVFTANASKGELENIANQTAKNLLDDSLLGDNRSGGLLRWGASKDEQFSVEMSYERASRTVKLSMEEQSAETVSWRMGGNNESIPLWQALEEHLREREIITLSSHDLVDSRYQFFDGHPGWRPEELRQLSLEHGGKR